MKGNSIHETPNAMAPQRKRPLTGPSPRELEMMSTSSGASPPNMGQFGPGELRPSGLIQIKGETRFDFAMLKASSRMLTHNVSLPIPPSLSKDCSVKGARFKAKPKTKHFCPNHAVRKSMTVLKKPSQKGEEFQTFQSQYIRKRHATRNTKKVVSDNVVLAFLCFAQCMHATSLHVFFSEIGFKVFDCSPAHL